MVYFILLSLVLANQPKIGFGFGQTLDGHLLIPSLFTMRVSLGESFVIAPELNFTYSSSDAEIDSVTGSGYTAGIEGNLYYSILKKKDMGFYGIGGFGFGMSRNTRIWYQRDWESLWKVEETTSSKFYGVNLGLGMEQFLIDRLSICISSMSNITLTYEETKRKLNGEEKTIRKNRDLSIDFQNLRCCIYLIWYIL